ncbi:TetR family transcriptional regulator [Streptomyces sp. Edi4]|uniref:TetR family transcriptional regulator n=1 Tax=Streptomyces sp. Edi4 TaxID=3162527 RepID=UPI0033062960
MRGGPGAAQAHGLRRFTGKDELVAEYLRRFDPSVLPGVFDRTDLTPRERLLSRALATTSTTPPVPLHRRRRRTPRPPAPRIPVRAPRLQESRRRAARRQRTTPREAGASADPEQLGEQLALLIDGAAARTPGLNADAFPTAAAIAAVLIDNAIPATSRR